MRLARSLFLFFSLPAALLALTVLGPAPSRGQDAEPAVTAPAIVILARQARNDRGHIRSGVYASREHFTQAGHEVATCVAPVSGGVSRCRVEGLPAGRYAIGLMHDEDDDGHFDQGIFGIPEEGYGFSRDASGGLGAPSFESAAFDYDGLRDRVITIRVRYGI